MPSLRDIKKRIISIENISKITKAMKMVSAAKLKVTQSYLLHTRIYFKKVKGIIDSLIENNNIDNLNLDIVFGSKNVNKKICLLVFTSDKGLCGSFNTNIIKYVNNVIKQCEDYDKMTILNVGKKGFQSFGKLKNIKLIYLKNDVSTVQEYSNKLTNYVYEYLITKQINVFCSLGYLFKNAVKQEINYEKIIPFKKKANNLFSHKFFVHEPCLSSLINVLIPKYISAYIYKNILESTVSEHAARVTAMENASRNAKDTFEMLNLQYNRVRQSNITRELMEIIAGSEAIK